MRIVSFTRSVPFDGIPHAGGEYYLRHVSALLEEGHSVTVVAPDDPENRDGAARTNLPVRVLLIDREGPRWLHYVDRFNIRFRVSVPPERFVRQVVSAPEVRSAVEDADLLEYQWTEFTYIHGRLPRVLTRNKPAVGVAHDVLTQKFRREADVPDLSRRRRLTARAKSVLVQFDETRMLRRMDRVLTFSQKDADRLASMLRNDSTRVIDPPLEPQDPRWGAPRVQSPARVLFVGAFYRPENSDGAMWFIREVWPIVTERIPGAELVLAGVGPDERMRAAASADPTVHITGYVEDLSPFYLEASLVVVPLLAGAGVKFKTITAMLWGVPIVATPIGVEGIGDSGEWAQHFIAVADDPARFGDAVVRALQNPEEAEVIGASAKRFAVARYGSAEFARKLGREYGPLVELPTR